MCLGSQRIVSNLVGPTLRMLHTKYQGHRPSDSGEDFIRVFRALDHPNLGPKFGPIPNAKKYVFFPNPDEKFPI